MTAEPTAPLDSDALLARVRAVLEANGTEVPEAALLAAVAAQATPSHPIEAPLPAAPLYDFGWERPRDAAMVEAHWRRMAWLRWPEQWMNRARQWPRARWTRVAGLGLGALICLLVTTGPTGLWVLLKGVMMGGTPVLAGVPLWGHLRQRQHRYDVIVPTREGWAAWAAQPRARAYVEACLASEVPFLLAGDLRRLRVIMGENS